MRLPYKADEWSSRRRPTDGGDGTVARGLGVGATANGRRDAGPRRERRQPRALLKRRVYAVAPLGSCAATAASMAVARRRTMSSSSSSVTMNGGASST